MNKIWLYIVLLIFSACKQQYTATENKENINISKDVSNDLRNYLSSNTKTEDAPVNSSKYVIAKYDCPVLNTYDFKNVYGGKTGFRLLKSKNGLVKPLEFVAFPGTVFEILDSVYNEENKIYKVRTDEYPLILEGSNIYVDSRFVEYADSNTEKIQKPVPSKKYIYDYFEKAYDAFYVWGANNINGVEKMFDFYMPAGQLINEDNLTWQIKGVDCSGLLYEATQGYTPRNTHQLVNFGEPVNIKGLNSTEIEKKLQPLDLIVWKGHIVIVFDNNTTIESSHSANGVIKKNLEDRLDEILSKRKPVNEWKDNDPQSFVVRRWFK